MAKMSLRKRVVIPFHSMACIMMNPARKLTPNNITSIIGVVQRLYPMAVQNRKKEFKKPVSRD
jgi:hypothetical protein